MGVVCHCLCPSRCVTMDEFCRLEVSLSKEPMRVVVTDTTVREDITVYWLYVKPSPQTVSCFLWL